MQKKLDICAYGFFFASYAFLKIDDQIIYLWKVSNAH